MEKRPEIIAHRGACMGLPDNSMEGFAASVANKADGLEIDVQLTKDNICVLYHDRTAQKLTGARRPIFSYTLDQLEKAGSDGRKIVTLEKAIELFKEKTRLYIEIKSGKLERKLGITKLIVQKVCNLVAGIEPEFKKNISFLSFDPDVLEHIHNMDTGTGYVLNIDEYAIKEKWSVQIKEILNKTYSVKNLTGLCINKRKLTHKLVTFAHDHDLKMFVYSCNTENQLKRLLGFKLDGIMTDRAQWLVKRMNHET